MMPNPTKPSELRPLLSRHGIRPRKAYGQNFLIDAHIPERMISLSGIDETAGVLEIGPGAGALTRPLAERAGRVLAVELDRGLLPVLEEVLTGFENAEVIWGDVLKIDFEELVKSRFEGLRPVAMANLPYYITTPAIARLIESRLFSAVTVMVQKEVASRITASPGTSDYGAFTLFVDLYAEPERLFNVPPGCFFPPPKVDSSVVILRVRETPPYGLKDPDFYLRTVRAAFSKRRKTLLNALSPAFPLSKEELLSAHRACGLPDDIRGERLSGEDFARLSDVLSRALIG